MPPANSTPTLYTYVEIFNGIIDTWDTCVPWAQPLWAKDLVFWFCMCMAAVYLYVLIVIIGISYRRKKFRSPFTRSIIVLAVGDIITVITTSKEGATQSCVLASIADLHLAWESIGAFSIDLIIGVNLVIAIVRCSAVTSLHSGNNQQRSFFILDCLLALAVVWAIAMGVLHHLGFVKQVWYPVEYEYHDMLFFPFNYLRTPMQFTELGLTFLIYVVATIQLQRIKKSINMKDMKKEIRFLALALLIFCSELLYVYSANWIGNNYFGWGSGEFNANLNYTVRPITTGITPLFYIIFSSEIRDACFMCCTRRKEKVVPLTNGSSVFQSRSARSSLSRQTTFA